MNRESLLRELGNKTLALDSAFTLLKTSKIFLGPSFPFRLIGSDLVLLQVRQGEWCTRPSLLPQDLKSGAFRKLRNEQSLQKEGKHLPGTLLYHAGENNPTVRGRLWDMLSPPAGNTCCRCGNTHLMLLAGYA